MNAAAERSPTRHKSAPASKMGDCCPYLAGAR